MVTFVTDGGYQICLEIFPNQEIIQVEISKTLIRPRVFSVDQRHRLNFFKQLAERTSIDLSRAMHCGKN